MYVPVSAGREKGGRGGVDGRMAITASRLGMSASNGEDGNLNSGRHPHRMLSRL